MRTETNTNTQQLQDELATVEATAKRLRERLAQAERINVGDWVVRKHEPSTARKVTHITTGSLSLDGAYNSGTHNTGGFVENFCKATPEEIALAQRGPAPFQVGDVVFVDGVDGSPLRRVEELKMGSFGWDARTTQLPDGQDRGWSSASIYRKATPAEQRVLTHFVPKVGMLLRNRVSRVRFFVNSIQERFGGASAVSLVNLDARSEDIPMRYSAGSFTRAEYEILPSVTLTGVGE